MCRLCAASPPAVRTLDEAPGQPRRRPDRNGRETASSKSRTFAASMAGSRAAAASTSSAEDLACINEKDAIGPQSLARRGHLLGHPPRRRRRKGAQPNLAARKPLARISRARARVSSAVAPKKKRMHKGVFACARSQPRRRHAGTPRARPSRSHRAHLDARPGVRCLQEIHRIVFDPCRDGAKMSSGLLDDGSEHRVGHRAAGRRATSGRRRRRSRAAERPRTRPSPRNLPRGPARRAHPGLPSTSVVTSGMDR